REATWTITPMILGPIAPRSLPHLRQPWFARGLNWCVDFHHEVHGVDASGQVAVRCQLRRSELLAFFQSLPPCLVATAMNSARVTWSAMAGKMVADTLADVSTAADGARFDPTRFDAQAGTLPGLQARSPRL